ncbi:hypothetical protein ABMZ17_25290, partial [Escherichia coli]|uniref:hypothetical protein n=1 Tax=Escherichia coli TaxID=562 RepID=UPI0039BDCB2F
LDAIADRFRSLPPPLSVNIPVALAHDIHIQWPFQLLGTPLSLSISVNNLAAVKALLSLGADPQGLVYCEGQFPASDPRSKWTALHI